VTVSFAGFRRDAADRLRQIGPTLFWMLEAPRVGEQFRTRFGRWAVLSVEHSPQDGGFLVVVESL